MRLLRKQYLPELLIGSLFLSLSVAVFLLRWKFLVPFPYLAGDAANYAGFAAALDNPALFAKDPLLGKLENINFYLTFHIPLARFLAKALDVDYASGWLFSLIPQLFLQLCGFYILGRVLFHSRLGGVLFSFLSLARIDLNLATFWGFHPDPLARTTFQSCLPFLLAGAVHWRSKPTYWPILMTLAGLCIYVHPVSTPIWALAIWTGLWLGFDPNWSGKKRVAWMGLCGLTFLIVAGPFIANYFSTYEHGQSLDYDLIYPILKQRYAPGYHDIPLALTSYFSILSKEPVWFFGLFSIAIVVTKRKTNEEQARLNLILTWFCVLAVFGALFPLLEQELCKRLRLIPPEIDLIRNIRYFVLFLEIAVFSLLWRQGFPRKLLDWAQVTVFSAAYCTIIIPGFQTTNGILSLFNSDSSTNYFSPSELDIFNRDLLTDISHLTPPGSTLLTLNDDLALPIRYGSLRSVLYTFKDGGVLGYANHQDLVAWDQLRQRISQTVNTYSDTGDDEKLIQLASELDVHALVLPFEISASVQESAQLKLLKQWEFNTQRLFLYSWPSLWLNARSTHQPLMKHLKPLSVGE